MDMFTSYDNLPADYIPDNTTSTVVEYESIDTVPPRKEYNVRGNFIGYSWVHGETFELPFSVERTITVMKDSVVYNVSGEKPTTLTDGRTGQQAFNTVDGLSWTCVGMINSLYVWERDESLTYPKNGTRKITLIPNMENKELQIEVFNFRWESIYAQANKAATSVSLLINKDTSELMKPGVYYCILSEIDGSNKQVISKTALYVK